MVAALVAVPVVDGLEVVEVEHQHGHLLRCPMRALQFGPQAIEPLLSRGAAGHRVNRTQLAELLDRLRG